MTGNGQLRQRLGSVLSSTAPLDVRLSFATMARRCSDTAAQNCRIGIPTLNRLAAIAGDAAASLRSHVSIDALHAIAAIDLFSTDTSGKAIDRSIKYLEMIARLDPQSSDALADLSAAYMVRAGMRRDTRDLLLSLERSSDAIGIDSAHVAAQYNRALALDRLGLDGEATKAWGRYLERDSDSGWGLTGREHLRTIRSRRTQIPPSAGAPPESLATFVVTNAYLARTFAWDVLLGEWGAAVVARDAPRATARLAAARTMADTLATRFGDYTLVHVLDFIAQRRVE